MSEEKKLLRPVLPLWEGGKIARAKKLWVKTSTLWLFAGEQADTLWVLVRHKEKDRFGLAARRGVRTGELVGDLQGGRGRGKKAKKSCGTARGPQSYPCTRQDSTRNLFAPNEAFCRADIIVWGKGGPERRIYKRGADAVFFWGTHLTHVVFTFCPVVQFLWTRLSLECGARILISSFPAALETWGEEKRMNTVVWLCIGWHACWR